MVTKVKLIMVRETMRNAKSNKKCATITRGKTITRETPHVLVDLRKISETIGNDSLKKKTKTVRYCSNRYRGKPVMSSLSRQRKKSQGKPPALLKSFGGITDTGIIPPDTMGTAGSKHLVSIVNGGYAVFSKSIGKRRLFLSLKKFWSHLGTRRGRPAFQPFDPKILYDQFSRRFIAVSASGIQAPDNPGSWLLVGISGIDNPFVWKQWAIKANPVGGNWADYPMLGLDHRNVYISSNLYRGDLFQKAKIWVISKQSLLLPSSQLTWTEFTGPEGSGATTQPTHVMDPAENTHYFIGVKDNTSLKINKITFKKRVPIWRSVGSVKIKPYPNQMVPQAKQKGSRTPIHTGDDRILNALYRFGHIWAMHHVPSNDGRRTEVAWYEINPRKKSVVNQGRIKDPRRFYYYPSIAVNKKKEVVVGFSGSSSKLFAGGYYTGRKPADPPGTMRAVSTLKKGRSSYVQLDDNRLNRWGDYSATVSDPNGNSFWTIQEYAISKRKWGTWWGKVMFKSRTLHKK